MSSALAKRASLSPRQAMKFRAMRLRVRTQPISVEMWNRWRDLRACPLDGFSVQQKTIAQVDRERGDEAA